MGNVLPLHLMSTVSSGSSQTYDIASYVFFSRFRVRTSKVHLRRSLRLPGFNSIILILQCLPDGSGSWTCRGSLRLSIVVLRLPIGVDSGFEGSHGSSIRMQGEHCQADPTHGKHMHVGCALISSNFSKPPALRKTATWKVLRPAEKHAHETASHTSVFLCNDDVAVVLVLIA